ncbi:acid protease [Umbelopsis sp. PMI_123]|nr:acid protease [Umbelopsis sp. PMI_123]
MMRLSLLLAFLTVIHAVIAAVITQRSSKGNLISLPMRRSNLINGAIKSARKRGAPDQITIVNKLVHISNGVSKLILYFVQYTISVGIGNPPTDYDILVDTGSSNTFVGAGKPYTTTSTSSPTGQTFDISYGTGAASGNLYYDQITLSPGAVIPKETIGVANKSRGLDGFNGILGLGPDDLTKGTTSDNMIIPTVLTTLYHDGTIPAYEFSLSFEPTTSLSDANGELILGGTDSSKYTGPLSFVPMTTTQPASDYWGVDASATYGQGQSIMSSTAGIVDSGTSLILLATDAFQAYQKATGAVLDSNTSLLKLTADQFANLKSLYFHIGDQAYELTPNACIFPRSLNTAIGGDPNGIYLMIGDIGTPSGSGLDFMLGMAFFERHYILFDTANKRVGFATTPFTQATTN